METLMTLDQALGNCERESIIDDSVDGDTAVAVGHQYPELRRYISNF